jgi:SAM-dependent methyltransferase
MEAQVASTEFNSEQYDGVYPDGIENHYWTLARNRMICEAALSTMPDRKGTVMDVGCGRGITIDYLRRRGLAVFGCDLGQARPICPEIAPYLRHGVDATTLPLEERSRARTLMLLDVLEHVPQPAELVRGLWAAFPAAESLIITVPARQEIWTNYDEFNGHFLRYDFTTAHRLFPADLFDVRRMTYLFHLLYPAAKVLKGMGKKRQESIHPPKGPLRTVHAALAAYFVAESKLLPSSLPGTSLMLILRRK